MRHLFVIIFSERRLVLCLALFSKPPPSVSRSVSLSLSVTVEPAETEKMDTDSDSQQPDKVRRPRGERSLVY